MRRSTNTVRLLDPEKAKKRGALGRTASAPKTLKLAVRLLETINGPVRGLTHYRGDLSEIVTDAVRSTDLNTVGLVDIAEAKVAETCVMISEDVYRTLKKASKERSASLNALVNTALAHWLAAKKAVRLLGGPSG
jgi:hypothetical protein